MKFLLLKTLLLRKRRDEGFTLPMVIAIGMVMVLLSAVNLVQSGEENLNAISQEGSSDALAMAELGVSRYRDLLINNRVLAVTDLGSWTNPNILNQVCTTGIDGAGGWADTSDNNGWRDINVGGTVIGSYKLEAYEYDRDPDPAIDNNDFDQVDDVNNDLSVPPDGNTDAVGLLTVQGQDNIGSIAQLQVTIPLGVNTQDFQNLQPGLWIHQSSVSNTGTINVTDGNIVVYRDSAPASGTSDLCQNTTIGGFPSYSAIRDSRDLPPIVDLTGLTVRRIQGDVDTNNSGTDINFYRVTNPTNNQGEIVLGTTFDNTGATQALNTVSGQDFYYYRTNSQNLRLDDGQAIIADGDSRVVLYVDVDLDITTGANGVRLVNSRHFSEAVNPATATTVPGIARYFEIHVNGNVFIRGNGTLDITGLLHVPNGTVNITGSSTVNVTGSIWANNWNASSGATINIDTDRTTVNGQPVSEYNFFSITPERTPAPITFRPSSWERQEAN